MTISIQRLTRVLNDADAAFASLRNAGERLRGARRALAGVNTRLHDFKGDPLQNPSRTDVAERDALVKEIAELVLDIEHLSGVSQHVGRLKMSAIDYVRRQGVTLPTSLAQRISE